MTIRVAIPDLISLLFADFVFTQMKSIPYTHAANGDPAYIPVQLQQQVKNNLGGHWNHSFFWELMKPGGAKEPSSELKSAIEGSWKDVNEFKERLNAAGVGRFIYATDFFGWK